MKPWKHLAAVLLLGSISVLAPAAAEARSAPAEDELGATIRTELVAGLGDLTSFDIDALQRDVLLEHGELQPVIVALERIDADPQQDEVRRRNARWVRAVLLARRGDLERALGLFEYFSDQEPENFAARLEFANLLNALGQEKEAVAAYEALLPAVTDEELEARVRIRLAILRMERDEAQRGALAEFASEEGRDPAVRNRAAVVLGLIGRPAEAIEVYRVDGDEEHRFRQEVRVAEWAIRAKDAERAQEAAWRAVRSARLHRDRHYGLTVLVEAHRLDDSLDALIDRFAATPDLNDDSRGVWIDLLREMQRAPEAIELFRGAAAGTFTVEMRRELLEMYRESGDDEVMIGVFGELIREEPLELEWREGLSRAYLERGDREAGLAVWRSFLDGPGSRSRWLGSARVLMELGLDELAIQAAEQCIATGVQPLEAVLFLFDLHRDRGRLEDAVRALERMDRMAPEDAAERYQLADGWERLGRLRQAVEVLERVRVARGEEASGEDLEMRLAWLYSEIGEEETALSRWAELWRKLKSVSRRRYAEDRMMTVASRLGTLADIAIDLEQKLLAGTASDRDSGLLVRLYTKVGDPVSAAEVIEEFLKQSGGSVVEALQEKARVYLSCNDYYDYEKTIRQLIEVDPEGAGDYLRQLAMSQLERGKPDEAREVLVRLGELEMGTESAEFEAGVLALAGLREEAIGAYWKGLAANPGRIESYLLMANLMKELGRTKRAVGMFQYLAATAEKDDLFTIAIDGLLNLEAPEPVLNWARRITLERLAGRHDKMYLYQLLADLSEAAEDREGMITALEGSLAISGERRPSTLRELMDLARGGGTSFTGRGWAGDSGKHLAFGRRLIGLAEVVPPQVYLDLGEVFLQNGEPRNATRTFRLASDLPDYPVFQRQAAALFEQTGYRKEALEMYKRVLVAQSSDVGLMVKVGELEEQDGRDSIALGLYRRALELLYSRQALSTVKAEKRIDQSSRYRYYGSRNIDAYDKYHDRLLRNLLVVLTEPAAVEELMAAQRAAIDADLAQLSAANAEEPEPVAGAAEQRDTLRHHPRLLARSDFHRRLAVAYHRVERADELDAQLLAAFPEDDELLEELCQERLQWGLFGSVRRLLDVAARPPEERERLGFLVGEGLDERTVRRLPLDQAERLFFTPLIDGRTADAGVLIRRTDFTRIEKDDLPRIEPLFSASIFLRDENLTLRIAREWLRLNIKHRTGTYQVERLLERCEGALGKEEYRNLCLSVTDVVLEEPEKHSSFLTLLPELQKDFDEPLITEEQVLDLLDEYADGGWGFGLGPVISLLPEEQRGAAMRTVWSKIKPTSRAQFLLNLVDDVQEELGEAVSEFVRGAFPDSLGDADEIYPHYLGQLADSRFNHQLGLDLLEMVIEREPQNWIARSARAVKLLVLERPEEALAEALEVYVGLLDDDGSDYQKRQAIDRVVDKFLPEHLDAFVVVLDEREAEGGESVALTNRRIQLYEEVEEPEQVTELLVAAVERFPEEQTFLERLERSYSRADRRAEAMVILERLAALEPERKPQLAARWKALGNPVKALEVEEQLLADPNAAPPAPSIPGVPASVILQPGATVITSAGTFVVGGSGGGARIAEDLPTIQRVKDAVSAEDWAKARTFFRRLWRQFPVESSRRSSGTTYYFGGSFGRNLLAWPEDAAEEAVEDESKAPSRGGLDGWSDEEPAPAEPARTAYEALAEYDFGVSEMERILRSQNAQELDAQRAVFEGLLQARIRADGLEATLERLVEAVAAGGAGKVETNMLLTLLDRHPELQSEATNAVLGDLLREVRPTDVGPLRQLARVHARQGNRDEARRIYTWCATRTDGSGFPRFDSGPTIPVRELINEVKEQLDGEDRLEVIEAVIDFADPRDYPWARENFEMLVLDTFMELLDAPEALERCRKIAEEATDFRAGLRRNTAKRAAVLWARVGDIETALRCLEYGVCSLPQDVVEGDEGYWNSPTVPGYWGTADIKGLFPADPSAFAAPREWNLAAAAAVSSWLEEDRVRVDSACQALVILSVRLQALGELDVARELVRTLAERDDLTPARRLWVVDAARVVGQAALADAIERELFDAGALHLERLHEVVRRELETAGPEAALALGEEAIPYTLHAKLLEVLVEAARATGDEATIARWEELDAARAAAEARLEEIEEERKEAASVDR